MHPSPDGFISCNSTRVPTRNTWLNVRKRAVENPNVCDLMWHRAARKSSGWTCMVFDIKILICIVILIIESIVEILATLVQKSNKHSQHYGCISRSLNKRIVHRFVPSIAATAGSPADGDSFSDVRSQQKISMYGLLWNQHIFCSLIARHVFGGWYHGKWRFDRYFEGAIWD